MDSLSVRELDLLERVVEKPELQAPFFRKVKGLKWFEPLKAKGFFDAVHFPVPVQAEEKGYFRVPRWNALDYLVNTSKDLTIESAPLFAPKVLEIIRATTEKAMREEASNYHVWWQFSDLLCNIPSEFISIEDIDLADYWLEDRFETGLVAGVLGSELVYKCLTKADAHSKSLALRLIDILFRVRYSSDKKLRKTEKRARLRIEDYQAAKIHEKVSFLSGSVIGYEAVSIFSTRLTELLNALKNDRWSSVWQPAIEEHEQNRYHDGAENIVLWACRDCLSGFVEANQDQAGVYTKKLLQDPHDTIARIAIYCVTQHYGVLGGLAELIIDPRFFDANFRHETWHFLNRHYGSLSTSQRNRIITIIDSDAGRDDPDASEATFAFEKARWLSAIHAIGDRERVLYEQAISVSKVIPEHPDFSTYSFGAGWVDHKSPVALEELIALSSDDLVKILNEHVPEDVWGEPSTKGLSKAVREVFVSEPMKHRGSLTKFAHLGPEFLHPIVEAYYELWKEKANLPWDDLWGSILDFLEEMVSWEGFWSVEASGSRGGLVASRNWVVGAIGRLLELSCKADDHAISEVYLPKVEKVLSMLLNNEDGANFEVNSDAVSVAINSSRGQCIEALINLTLRSCRLADGASDGNHLEAWLQFRPYFEVEMERSQRGEYEFATLFGQYIPNFLYMNKDWTMLCVSTIFDHSDYKRWLCAMQGYSYVGTVYEGIYGFLKSGGHFLRALDDENLAQRAEDRFVQQIAIAYLNDFERIGGDNSLIDVLVDRGDVDEISNLIWFCWTLREESDPSLTQKVYDLWSKIVKSLNLETQAGKKIASQLAYWSDFVDKIDQERMLILLEVAPYADYSHNAYHLLESLARISDSQPLEANEVWQRMLSGKSSDYPEEAIKKLLSNLVAEGPDGLRAARKTVSLYLSQGMERPANWLRNIVGSP